ncbi:MAG: glycosyltransferase family 4 protein, partial [Candidatus Thorarchaeota archaeon]
MSLEIIWNSPAYDPSGYASCARDYILSLDKAGIKVKFEAVKFWSPISTPATTNQEFRRLKELEEVQVSENCPHVTHMVPDLYKKRKDKHIPIGYTVFETDSLPEPWLEKMDLMKLIFVPCKFNYDTFTRAGFNKDKLRIIPHIVNTERLDPNKHKSLSIPIQKKFYFLSIMDATFRKGWDVLLRSYLREFQNNNDVGLIFKGYFGGVTENHKRKLIQKIKNFKDSLNVKNPPEIIFYGDILDNDTICRLYKSTHCYVSSTRGDGWNLPLSEALAMEIPSIATNFGGQLEFMNESNSYLIDVLEMREYGEEMTKITPNYKGQNFAEPSEVHLRQLMRHVYENYDEAKNKAIKGRQDLIENFSWKLIIQKIINCLEEL